MRRLLIILSGARPEVLAQCPSETGKFIGLGIAVLTTGFLSAVSMSLVLVSVRDADLVLAMGVGLVWGFVVMLLVQWLVVSSDARGVRRLLPFLPRLTLTLMIGLLISEPLVLQIFKSEIDAQIVEIRQADANAFQRRLSEGEVGKEIARLSRLVSELRVVIDSGGAAAIDPATDLKMASLMTDLKRARKQRDQYYDAWRCELYGESCRTGSSGNGGNGPIARQAEERYRTASREVAKLDAQIADRERELTEISESAKQARLKQAEADLPGYQAQLERHLRRQADLQAEFDTQDRGDGLLVRIQALEEISAENPPVRVARILLFLLMALITGLPLIIKLIHRPGVYEKILQIKITEEHRLARAQLRFDELNAGGTDQRPTLEEVWKRESRERESSPPALDDVYVVGTDSLGTDSLGTDTEELQDRALRDMRDARVPEDPDASSLPRGQRP